jgi:hypothetical protein
MFDRKDLTVILVAILGLFVLLLVSRIKLVYLLQAFGLYGKAPSTVPSDLSTGRPKVNIIMFVFGAIITLIIAAVFPPLAYLMVIAAYLYVVFTGGLNLNLMGQINGINKGA